MLERFSSGARRSVELAEGEARRLRHGHVGTEHLLLGVLAEGESWAAQVLVAAGGTLDRCRWKVAEAVPKAADGGSVDLRLTDRAKRALERAERLSLDERDVHVEARHVLLGLLDVEGTAGQVLRGLSVDLAGLRAALAASTPGASIGVEPAGDDDRDAVGAVAPRCAVCGAGLDAALAHRTMPSEGGDGRRRDLLVAYCAECGSAVGATSA